MTPAPDRRTGRPPKRAYQPKPAGETKTPARLPAEVEGLVEMMARDLYATYAWGSGTAIKWVDLTIPQKQQWKDAALSFLTLINEHLGGRVVILDKDQTAPKIIVPSHSEGIVCPVEKILV